MREAIHPLPQYVFMAWCLVKHRDKFNLLYFKNAVFLTLAPEKKRYICFATTKLW
jgi:hypothetical protein